MSDQWATQHMIYWSYSNKNYQYEIPRITNMKLWELQNMKFWELKTCNFEHYSDRIKGQGTTGAQLRIFLLLCPCRPRISAVDNCFWSIYKEPCDFTKFCAISSQEFFPILHRPIYIYYYQMPKIQFPLETQCIYTQQYLLC